MEVDEKVLIKWKNLIEACKNYYVDSKPTGWTDAEFDAMEAAALEDGFPARDYVLDTYLKGVKTENKYIEKFKKEKVTGSMLDALKATSSEYKGAYYDLKYDGCSIAVYLDSKVGTPQRVVTVGNTNLSSFGVDQTWKLLKFLPKRFAKGIKAIQCEALIDIERLEEGAEPDRARQMVSGLINGKKEDVLNDVDNLLTLRAYRYYTDDSAEGVAISGMDYRDVLSTFPTVKHPVDGHILFAPADVYTIEELIANPDICKEDRTKTSTGTFLNDGWVVYKKSGGDCWKALKFAGAGSGTELITTKVLGIKWNNQVSKGKDSWSANVLIEPVSVHGSIVRKPSAGSVSKLVKGTISKGAEVSVIMANSTIPMVGEAIKPGNGDYEWPTCSCGYQMSEKDIYKSNLKCGNPLCSERIERMTKYINSLSDIRNMDLNKLLVIDAFKWENTDVNIETIINFVMSDQKEEYYKYLCGYMDTPLRIRNLDLVWQASWSALRNTFISSISI